MKKMFFMILLMAIMASSLNAMAEFSITDIAKDDVIELSATHRHSYSNKINFADKGDGKHHTYQTQCKCGELGEIKTAYHRYDKKFNYRKVDESTHSYQQACKDCGYTRTVTQKHTRSSSTPLNINDIDFSNHQFTYNCKYCKDNYTVTSRHRYNNEKVCKDCGHDNSKGQVAATTRDGAGACGGLIDHIRDKWVYSKCPKCGSSDCRLDYMQKISTEKIGDSVICTIYHQHVICNNCNKKYTNRCFQR